MKKIITLVAASVLTFASYAAGGQPTAAQVDAAFKKADPDNDGTVSWAEALKFGISREAFQKANPDKDETLDLADYLEALTAEAK